MKERPPSLKRKGDDDDDEDEVVNDSNLSCRHKRRRVRKGCNDTETYDSPQILRFKKVVPTSKTLFPPKPTPKKAKIVLDQLYGRPVPQNPTDICAGCLGARNDELCFEPILLCDGPGCNAEYHLQCCLPETTEIPKNEYFCIDCSLKGSSGALQQYLEKVDEDRAEFKNSCDFVKAKLKEGMKWTSLDNANVARESIPLSELDRLSVLHHIAISELGAPTTNPVLQTPDFLVGKPIRLYSPNDNQYHTGRIVEWRKVGHCVKFWGSTEISHCEFLVRFQAGMDSRKVPYRAWIILEEHSCAIGVSMVWAHHKKVWRPAMTWLRTSLELLPVRSQLDETLHQIYTVGCEAYTSDHHSWSLVSFLGDEKEYALMLLQKETSQFNAMLKESATENHQLLLLKGLAEVELQEQDHIRAWYQLPLRNKMHPLALSMQDENSLTPIAFKNIVELDGPQPVQLLQEGLDRIWLIHLLGAEGTCKDHVLGEHYKLVDPGPALMTHYFKALANDCYPNCKQE